MSCPIVLRFASIHPRDLGRIAMHGERRGGDLSHIDRFESEDPEEGVVIGRRGWVEKLRCEIAQAADDNANEAVSALNHSQRPKQASKRRREGAKTPFRASKGGPLREAILTVERYGQKLVTPDQAAA